MQYYTFFLYGYFTLTLSDVFFPLQFGELISLNIFALAFFSKPLGGAVFGYIGDRFGRKISIVSSFIISGFATMLMGCIPDYTSIGVLAPILLSILRLIQGLTLGGQAYTSVVFMSEYAEKEKQNFSCSILTASSFVGALLAALSASLSASIEDYGWRLPFILGGAIMIGLWRPILQLEETETFKKISQSVTKTRESYRHIFRKEWKGYLTCIFVTGACLTPFYLITIYVSNIVLAKKFSNLPLSLSLINLCFLGVLILVLPIFGKLADRKTEQTLLVRGFTLLSVFSLPLYFALLQTNSIAVSILILLVFAIILAVLIAPISVYQTLLFKTHNRCFLLSTSANISAAFFGGVIPVLVDYLTKKYQLAIIPGLTLTITSILGIVCVLFSRSLKPNNYAENSQ